MTKPANVRPAPPVVNKPSKIAATTNFVKKHRVAIAVTITASAALALQMRTAKQFNEFLKEHDLFDKFYETFEDVAEPVTTALID